MWREIVLTCHLGLGRVDDADAVWAEFSPLGSGFFDPNDPKPLPISRSKREPFCWEHVPLNQPDWIVAAGEMCEKCSELLWEQELRPPPGFMKRLCRKCALQAAEEEGVIVVRERPHARRCS